MNPRLFLSSVISLLTIATAFSQNSLVITYAEDPDSFNSSLSHTTVFDFNHLATGNHTNVEWDGVGTFDRLTINNADQYGGAGNPEGSPYSVQGANGVDNTTLTFAEPHAYFGFWWSAGDSQNLLEFYSGETLVASFTTATLLNKIASSPEYYGNPTSGSFHGLNTGEPYAFINFFGEGNTTWDRIVLSNTSGSGFESDNYTDRKEAYGYYAGEDPENLPGVAVARVSGNTVTVIPEPSAALLTITAFAGLLSSRRRRMGNHQL